ncbi:MAG: hypothetical protein ACKVLA_20115, partial [Rhodobacterales bacterium]
GQMYLEQIKGLNARVAELDAKMRCAAQKAEVVRRAQTMPGVGPPVRASPCQPAVTSAPHTEA